MGLRCPLACSAIAVGLTVVSCRRPNPDWQDDLPGSTRAEHSGDTRATGLGATALRTDGVTSKPLTSTEPGTSASAQDPTTTTQSPTLTSSAQTSAPPSEATTVESSSQASSSSEDTSTGTQPSADAYCGEGVAHCFMMDRLEMGKLLHHPDTGPAFLLGNAGNLAPVDLPPYPLPSMVQYQGTEHVLTDTPIAIPPNKAIGFDLWLRPSQANASQWTSFAILGLMGLRRLPNEVMSCLFNQGELVIDSIELTRTVTFAQGQTFHFACAYDGERAFMWVDGQETSDASITPPNNPATATLALSWLNATMPAYAGLIGAVRVWTDIDAMRATIASQWSGPLAPTQSLATPEAP